MKRAAESQLTKDTSDGEDETPEPSSGFQKADPSVLGARKIRGLPRRSHAASSIPIEQAPESAFRGFGETRGSNHPFSFTLSSSQASKAPSQLTPPAFKPLVSFSNPPQPTPPTTPPLTPDSQHKQDAALKYYMALRGINLSFLDAATKAIQADPFVAIIEMLEKYKSLRLSVQQEFDNHIKSSGTGETTKAEAQTVTSQDSSSEKVSTSMRTSTNTGLGMSPGSFTTTFPGFIPKVDNSPGMGASPFTWSKPFRPTSMSDKPPSGASSTPGETTMSAETSGEGSSPAFGPSKSAANASDSNVTVVSQPILGKNEPRSERVDTSISTFKPSASAAPFTPSLPSFSSSSKPFVTIGETSTQTKLGAPSALPSTFGFGAGKNLGASGTFGALGKGSIGNPVGFGFGSPSIMPSSTDASDVAPAPGIKASSEATSGSGTKAPAVTDGVDASSSTPPGTEHDPSPAPSQGSVYDVDGPGEEDENTLHETKARAYRMISTGEKKGWAGVGTGQIKLKAHNELGKRRMLMRNSSTGQVILNFNLFPAFRVTVDKSAITFCVPGEDESAVVYRLKVPAEVDALKWQETISHEVNNLVPSSTDT